MQGKRISRLEGVRRGFLSTSCDGSSKSAKGDGGKLALVRAASVVVEALERRALLAANPLDPTFSGDGRVTNDISGEDSAAAIIVLPDGKVLAAGTANLPSFVGAGNANFAVVRYTASGVLDSTFGRGGSDGDGVVTTDFTGGDDIAAALLLLPGGKFLVGGSTRAPGAGGTGLDFAVARYNADGSLDRAFGPGGSDGDGRVTIDFGFGDDRVAALALLPDGDVVAVGAAATATGSDFGLARYNSDGSLDKGFGGGDGLVTTDFPVEDDSGGGEEGGGGSAVDEIESADDDTARTVRLLSDGDLLVAGAAAAPSEYFPSNTRFALARYNGDGSLDEAFGGGDGLVTTEVASDRVDTAEAIELLPDGDVLVAGEAYGTYSGYYSSYPVAAFALVRYNADGSSDAAFPPRATFGIRGRLNAVSATPDRTFLIAGTADGASFLARTDLEGRADPTFNNGNFLFDAFGGASSTNAVAVQPDGRAVATGDVVGFEDGVDRDFALLRLKPQVQQQDGDDQLLEAVALPVGAAKTTGISLDTDVDLYRFTVTAGQRVAFDVDRTAGSGLDALLRLFDAFGNEIASVDDAPAPGEAAGTLDPYLNYLFPAAGTYYVGVSGSPNDAYDPIFGINDKSGGTGGYRLTLTDIPVPLDRDDQIAEAVTLTVGGGKSTRIDPDTDVDMYKFAAGAGQRVAFDVDLPAGATLDPALRLFAADATPLAFSDNDAAPGEAGGLESYLEFTFENAGTYYVAVSASANTNYDPVKGTADVPSGVGSYRLNLAAVANDVDDQIAEAAPLAAGSSASGAVSPDTDVDMYKFAAVAGQHFGIDLDRSSGSLLDSQLRLFDAAGNPLDANVGGAAPDETSAPGESYLEFVALAAGDFYVGVSGANNGGYDPVTGANDNHSGNKGAYRLALLEIAPDPDDQAAEATAVAIGSTTQGSINPGSDVDLFKFDVRAGQTLAFDVDVPAGGTLNPLLRLFNTDNEITRSDDNPAPGEPQDTKESYIELRFDFTGTFYVGVSASANGGYCHITGVYDRPGGTGDYSLTVTEVLPPEGPPDDDDQIAEAKPLALNERVEGEITAGDVDMYAFSVERGRRVLVQNESLGVNGVIALFDAAGNLLTNSSGSIDFTLQNAGTFYVGYSGQPNTSYDPVTGRGDNLNSSQGRYALTVIAPGADPDDQIAEAVPATGAAQAGRIEPGDVDMYSAQVTDGERLAIEVSSTNFDPYTIVFNAAGERLVEGSGLYLFTPSQSGVYYVGVSSGGNNSYDPTTGENDSLFHGIGDYSVKIRIVPPDADDQISEALPASPSGTQVGEIDLGDDVDLYALEAQAGQAFSIDFDRPAGSNLFDPRLRVFDVSGKELAVNVGGRAPGETFAGEAYLEFLAPTAGRYYVGVSGGNNATYDPITGGADNPFSSTGAYELSIAPIAPDLDDQIAEARVLAVGASRNGTIGQVADVDMYKVAVAAGQRLGFDLDLSSGSGLDSVLRLFDVSGGELAANDDAAAPGETAGFESYVEYIFSQAGTYYIGVSSHDNFAYNPLTGLGDYGATTGGYTLLARQVASPALVTLEAENATLAGPTVAKTNAGYSGAGYADFTHASGDYVEWSMDRSAGAASTLTFRYANGSTAARTLRLSVDGVAIADLAFGATGSWSSWKELSAIVDLSAGAHRIRLTSIGSNGPNLDWLRIS